MELIDFSDDVILPDNFDASKETYDVDQEAPAQDGAPTTEPAAEAPAEAPAATEPTIATEEAPVVTPQTIKVKFNHEERELSFDEAAAYAQKGMNYDKLNERVAEYEKQNNDALLLAKRLGYESVSEMHQAAANNLYKRRVRELVEAGNTQAMAEFLVKQEFGEAPKPAEPQESKPQGQPTPEPEKSAIDTARMAELNEFVREYPKVEKLPDEVIAANKAGTRLIVAYERYLHKQDKQELAILRQNQAAAAKAPVTGVTGRVPVDSSNEAEDPFLKGFNHDSY